MCSSSNAVFAWIGAVLINIGFVTLIGWGATTIWPLGFGLCGLYAIVLWGAAKWMMNKETSNTSTIQFQSIPTEDESLQYRQQEPGEEEAGNVNDHKVSLPVSLLFGVAVVAIGVTGSFLPINLIHECQHSGGYQPEYTWITNVSALPEGVRQWATSPFPDGQNPFMASFGSTANVLLFSGSEYDPDLKYSVERLWTVQPGSLSPEKQPYYTPRTVVTVLDDHVCFVACSNPRDYNLDLYCFNGTAFQPLIDYDSKRNHGVTANAFLPYDSLLWFQEAADDRYTGEENGSLIYSLDPKTMNLTLHSQRIRAKPTSPCNRDTVVRQQMALLFFATALPVTVASILVWIRHQIPSMAITSYVGLSILFLSFYAIIHPQAMNEPNVAKWWGCISGLFCLLVTTFVNLLPDQSPRQQAPFVWGLVIASLAFASNTSALLVGDESRDELIYWVLLNVLVFAPLIVLGAANASLFVLFLGGCGLIADVARFAGFAGSHIPEPGSVPVVFLVFAVTGLMVGAVGFQVNKYQHLVRDFAVGMARQIHSGVLEHCPASHRSIEPAVDVGELCSESLLQPPAASEGDIA